MTLILDLSIDRSGTYRDPNLPAASFANYARYRQFAEECRAYEAAVVTYAAEIKPAAIAKAVRAARACGQTFITASIVRDSAEQGLRDALDSLCGFDEVAIKWHIANPGKRAATLFQ